MRPLSEIVSPGMTLEQEIQAVLGEMTLADYRRWLPGLDNPTDEDMREYLWSFEGPL